MPFMSDSFGLLRVSRRRCADAHGRDPYSRSTVATVTWYSS